MPALLPSGLTLIGATTTTTTTTTLYYPFRNYSNLKYSN